MAGHRRRPVVEALAAELVTLDGGMERRRPRALHTFAEVTDLARRDYGPALRRYLGRREVNELLAEARGMVWPHLNCEPLRLGGLREFVQRACTVGIDLRLARLSSPEGLTLFGFYVKRMSRVFERPLICVNSAHHPAVIATAFSHEMGHHVTAEIFGSRREPVGLLLNAGYAEHLDDPMELAADVLASLGMYSERIARRVLGGPVKSGPTSGSANSALRPVLKDVLRRYEFNLPAVRSIRRRIVYLAGLMHYTKMRQALLEEFGI